MRGSKIDVYGTALKQDNLFSDPSGFTKWFPPIYRDLDGFHRTLAKVEGKCGLDFEFPPNYKATIIGISSYDSCAAVPATPALVAHVVSTLRNKKAKFVGHSVIGAEKEVIKVTSGIDIGLDEFDDSMLKHYLLNADLAKAPDKSEKDDAGALGFMNLWTSTSLVLDVPNWKYCRGNDCEHIICPTHDVWGYCAVDAWSSLASDKIYTEDFKTYRVPDKLYDELKELTLIAQNMQVSGVKVDMPYVNQMEKKAKAYKAELFEDKTKFNPNASGQVVTWFASKGVTLEGNTKKDIQKALVKAGEKYGYEMHDSEGKFTVTNVAESEELPEVLDAAYRLYEYKSTGKGLDPWFAQKYRDSDDFIHPRFITIGASTSRWSSSRPNFTNIPARGFGSLVRAAIIPRDNSLDLLHADSSNLELRDVLYLAGHDPSELIPGDPFKWLVEASDGAFDKAASLANDTPRGIAKTVSHACLTGDHEVLTKSGWIKIEDYKEGIEVAIWKENKNIQWEVPKKFHKYPLENEKCIHMHGRGLDALCTTNHNWPVNICGTWNKKQYEKLRKEKANNLSISGRIPITGYILNRNFEISDWDIRKAVAIQAGGSYQNGNSDQIRFHLVKNRKKQRLEWLFDVEGKTCSCEYHKGKHYYIRHRSILLDDNKEFNENILKLSIQQLEVFLDEVTKWDGSVLNEGHVTYFSTSYKSAVMVQTAAHLCGLQGLLREEIDKRGNRKPLYTISFNQRQYASIESLEIKETVPFYSTVYCFSTSTGYFLIRRNNRISVTGNSSYLEGIKILKPHELGTVNIKRQVEAGALRIFKDWEYAGGVVAFTGANLAERIFGSKTWENRKHALEIQHDLYFKYLPMIPHWHRKILREIEETDMVRYPTGHFLRLYGSAEDNAKMGAAALGQGTGAHHLQGIILRYSREMGVTPILFVHDALDFEIPREWSTKQAEDFIRLMGEETDRLPGFRTPYKAFRGQNGLEFDEGKPATHIPGAMRRIV